MVLSRQPLSPSAQACFKTIGKRIQKTAIPPPPLQISRVVTSYTFADYQRYLRGDGPCPFGCCSG